MFPARFLSVSLLLGVWAFCFFGLVGFFCRGAHAAPCTPAPAPAGLSLWLACVFVACLVVMCRNSAPSSAFSGERGTGIAPRLPHPGDDTPPDPLAPQLRLVATLGLGGILCVSAPPLSSITLLIRHYPTHKKRSVPRQRSGTAPRFF